MSSEKKRRQTVMMLDGEEPPKKPRAPRSQRMRRNNSFAGVIIGEKKAEEEDLERPRVVETWNLAAVQSLLGNSSSSEAAATSSRTGAQQLLERSNSNSNSPPPLPQVEKTLAQEFSQQKQVIRAEEEQEQQSVAKLKRPSSARGFSTRNDMRSPLQDTSIERLQREATCRKLWQTPGDSELQRVPGSFASFDEYVGVFEPLLFEECRAQLHNSWEELVEGSSGDPFVPVSVKTVERRERGWYDVILMPVEPKRQFHFKEGDVAVLSTPKPGIGGRRKGRLKGGKVEEMEEGQIAGRVAGLVRRFHPIDVRDPPGAIFHFHVSQDEANHPRYAHRHFLSQLQKGGIWYLAGLGSITTIQREYSALHLLPAFRPQMMNAILRPHPELFPGYADQVPPAMPDCFTGAFIQHLQRSFNTPQLAAIQWAAAHTAAGSSELSNTPASAAGGSPWPFTLVQGPPGTGKTHTVWGMLNVIHLVQYQRYYAALLQKLAPGSLVASEELSLSNGSDREYDGDGWGTIDEVLQKMDRSLARVLPKLCPKPRMLVCAPSNAATDELLSRVLDRGFIDGEMKIYRPDVARVGVDTSSRAAQAVSVERRTEQLLAMEQPQVLGWLQQLRTREVSLAQHVAGLQRDLIDTAAAVRSQGNMGVEPDVLAARDQMRDGKLQQLAAVVEERDKVLVEMSRLFIIEVKFRAGSNFRIEEARRKLEASFANEAEIVFTTVSSSGRKIFSSLAHGFDMVVIDEAAQASEVAVLPPLSLRAARCVLVGDPQQLPATVISRTADTMQYSRSLFERFQQAGCPAILLSVQYRMHPRIRDFPSRYFYQGRLVDSESVQALPDEIYHKDSLLQPYLFFDVSHGRESHGGSVSYQNKMEAQVAIHLFEHLHKVLAEAAAAAAAGNVPPAKVSVGIITPYKQQLTCLEKEFLTVVGSNAASKGVYINTVDAFQGQERDVIIMSCVRASSHGVGFVADIRRMNVALTRARRSLWVIGNASALVQSEDWAALLADAKDRGCFVSSATCITSGLLPEPPMASTGILHQPPRSGPPLLSRGGRGIAPSSPMGGPHFLPGRHPFGTPPRTPGEEHWSSRRHGQDPVAFLERGDSEGQDLWQRSGQGRSCRGQREGAHPGFGPTFQHPGRRSKDL
ncbi:unnamed protein product [Sphagnum troendelagicum]